MHLTATILLAMLCSADGQINPVPRTVLSETAHEWTFDRDTQGWAAQNDCTVSAEAGVLRINSTGDDPFLHCGMDLPGGPVAIQIRARGRTAGTGRVFWTTDRSPDRSEKRAVSLPLHHDGEWHETTARFDAPGRLRDLRIDPGVAPGQFEIDWIRLLKITPHPLTVDDARHEDGRVRFVVKNHAAEPVEFTIAGKAHTVDAGAVATVDRPIAATRPVEPVSIEIECGKFPTLRRTVFVYRPDVDGRWIDVRSNSPSSDVSLQVAADGSAARIRRGGKVVAILGPIVHCDGKLPTMKPVEGGPGVRFRGDGVSLDLTLAGNEIAVAIDTKKPCEGPVVRALGSLEQGLFAGLEYLGKGEKSSSTLDIETPEHVRYAPDPMKVTMPLMSFVTDRASVAMTWDDMTLQPVYATPNFFDCDTDHRMALRGRKIRATICIDGVSAEETVYWAVQQKGLPPLPAPPRSQQQQWDLCLKGLNGPLKTDAGWGHCAGERWGRQPFADMASTVYRLTGKAPELTRLVPGGGHVRNGTIYFVTGRAEELLGHYRREAAGFIQRQQADGSYHYDGKYRRGHFEDTASGVCARPAAMLLEFARLTGDEQALAAGVRTLDYMKRFRTPRGAQVWEVALHTPDQLASAYLVWAYVRGFELTGNKEYLTEARRWALSGVPFTYLWDSRPIMLYSTPPVYGATNWVAPNWMGLPVQWVGGVYAYALTMLAPHDDSLDWNHLARGILLSAEQQQYPDGPHVGLLPDSFHLAAQRRQPADINPTALVSLRLALDGQVDFLSVAADAKHRVAAPFPVVIRNGKAHIHGKAGVKYQVLVDGRKIVEVHSQGEDVVELE
ncbi:MAG: hypothetical protein HQ567_27965 [Candidatus Nealsonbacteria bacterium]|nr:hypothetical protein [Candidatus Nealsonbacteria bacterium]